MVPTGLRRSSPSGCTTPVVPGFTPLAAFRVREVVDSGERRSPDDATAAVINLTDDQAVHPGLHDGVSRAGEPAPPSSNLNWIAGEDRAVGAIVGLGLGRTLCLMSEAPTNVIVDVTRVLRTGARRSARARRCSPTAVVGSSTAAMGSVDPARRSRPVRSDRSIPVAGLANAE